ncbi:hypothetical protein [Pseudomonas lijiangensis]|uniref:Uncharacterized protein n=1 Tax=Pseudomonas lijiangensis TaxID=2995658 RepID=A0ABX8HXN6_9PSED|nr:MULTISPECIES: hypothetical protein [Pseudomonas syringae group]MBX8499326.1 hypothetical protein [Pseudomonas lijiangensis]MBX8504905.1 hypothetical protein [Pseudomonas lijiangensis]MBX8545474.1 hypothetical protein [Pseudomonas cichorii]MBX8554199.1 hypothetical protein [Pseudomonas cichorii]MBX8598222.1 hypothetical protein [Pseudomonas cichorii]
MPCLHFDEDKGSSPRQTALRYKSGAGWQALICNKSFQKVTLLDRFSKHKFRTIDEFFTLDTLLFTE